MCAKCARNACALRHILQWMNWMWMTEWSTQRKWNDAKSISDVQWEGLKFNALLIFIACRWFMVEKFSITLIDAYCWHIWMNILGIFSLTHFNGSTFTKAMLMQTMQSHMQQSRKPIFWVSFAYILSSGLHLRFCTEHSMANKLHKNRCYEHIAETNRNHHFQWPCSVQCLYCSKFT